MRFRRTRTLLADDHQVEAVDGGWVTSMRVTVPNHAPRRLVLRLHDEAATVDGHPPIDRSATPFLPMLTMLAGAIDVPLRIDAAVDAAALDGARRAAALMAGWFGWPHLTVSARTTRSAPATPAQGTALFFSRGLDSMWSLFCGGHAVDQLTASTGRTPRSPPTAPEPSCAAPRRPPRTSGSRCTG